MLANKRNSGSHAPFAVHGFLFSLAVECVRIVEDGKEPRCWRHEPFLPFVRVGAFWIEFERSASPSLASIRPDLITLDSQRPFQLGFSAISTSAGRAFCLCVCAFAHVRAHTRLVSSFPSPSWPFGCDSRGPGAIGRKRPTTCQSMRVALPRGHVSLRRQYAHSERPTMDCWQLTAAEHPATATRSTLDDGLLVAFAEIRFGIGRAARALSIQNDSCRLVF